MALAYPFQKIQDWITQQWVIVTGKKINEKEYFWLISPFGNLNGIGENFIYELAEKENLRVERNKKNSGLLQNFEVLNLDHDDLCKLSPKIIHFYENTSEYYLEFKVKWHYLFRPFSFLLQILFSNRLNQLNIPNKNLKNDELIFNEIITLSDDSANIKYTFWLRKLRSSNKIIYSGIYGTCQTKSGRTFIKAVFPLPKGNATVLFTPKVEENGSLSLNSSGSKFGEEGFYFLLNDMKGQIWSKFIKSFHDNLLVFEEENILKAKQIMTLWNIKVLELNYCITSK